MIKLITLLNKLDLELNTAIAVYDMNFKEHPLFVGLLGQVTFEFLQRNVERIEFRTGTTIYKDEELFFEIKIVLHS